MTSNFEKLVKLQQSSFFSTSRLQAFTRRTPRSSASVSFYDTPRTQRQDSWGRINESVLLLEHMRFGCNVQPNQLICHSHYCHYASYLPFPFRTRSAFRWQTGPPQISRDWIIPYFHGARSNMSDFGLSRNPRVPVHMLIYLEIDHSPNIFAFTLNFRVFYDCAQILEISDFYGQNVHQMHIEYIERQEVSLGSLLNPGLIPLLSLALFLSFCVSVFVYIGFDHISFRCICGSYLTVPQWLLCTAIHSENEQEFAVNIGILNVSEWEWGWCVYGL